MTTSMLKTKTKLKFVLPTILCMFCEGRAPKTTMNDANWWLDGVELSPHDKYDVVGTRDILSILYGTIQYRPSRRRAFVPCERSRVISLFPDDGYEPPETYPSQKNIISTKYFQKNKLHVPLLYLL